MSNLFAWYRGDLGITLSTGVGTWADQSGNARDATQATGASQPTYNATDASFNNKPSLSFNRSQGLNTANFSVALSEPNTIYIVGKVPTTVATVQLAYDSVTFTTEQQFGTTTDGINPRIYGGTLQTGTFDMRNPFAACAVWNTTTNVYFNAINTTTISAAAGSGGLASLAIGALSSGVAWGGQIVELILYSTTHDSTARAQVMNYLAARYGLTISG